MFVLSVIQTLCVIACNVLTLSTVIYQSNLHETDIRYYNFIFLDV